MENNLIFPKYFSIQTTSLCNASCIFCPYEEIKNLFPKKTMEMSLYKKIINECSQYQNVERIILYLNNEPLTDSYLVKRINYAKEKVPWASVHILTNGSLLTEKLSQDLIDSELDWIGFSLHGTKKETIEKTMGLDYDLTFKRVLGFIERAKSKRNIQNFIMATFLRHKYLIQEEKDEAIKFWQDKGIKRISYFDGPVSRAGNVENLPQVRHKGVKGCTSIWANEMIHIVENGDVILCCMDWRREVILGNVNRQSIHQIWNSDKYKLVRDKMDGKKDSKDDFICKRCEAAIPQEETVSSQIVLHKNKSPDILLVICPPWGINMPPLGIAYLSRYLRVNNFTPLVLDLNISIFKNISKSFRDFWNPSKLFCWMDENFFDDSLKPNLNQEITTWAEKIVSTQVSVIGFSVNRANLRFTIELVKIIKQLDLHKIIIFGGPACSIEGERKLVPEGLVDIFVLGEGEQTLVEILNFLRRNQEIKELPGCIVRKGKTFSRFLPGKPIKDLNSIPFPDFSEFVLDTYQKKILPLLKGRGCLMRCSFCNDWSIWPKYRSRSADNIFKEIMYHTTTYNITDFEFVDLALNDNLNELERLCELIFNSRVKINWVANFTIKSIKNHKLFKKMKAAGCKVLRFGIESGSDKILKRMNKPFNSAEAEKVLKQSYNAKIENHINLIVGFPGENDNDFFSTLSFIGKNKNVIHKIANVHPCYLTPGSVIEKNYKMYDVILPKENFAMMWHDKEGNTYEKRKKKALEVKYLAKKLHIPFDDKSALIFYEEKLKEEDRNLHLSKENIKPLDILLVICPVWGINMPPLSLAYIASYLKSKKINLEVLDLNIDVFNNVDVSLKRFWEMSYAENLDDYSFFNKMKDNLEQEIEYCVEKILSFDCNLIGFSVYAPNRFFSVKIMQRIKQRSPQKIIVAGGRGIATPDERKIFPEGVVDYFFIGEGEKPLASFIQRLRDKQDFSNLKGVVSFQNRFYNLNPYIIEDLNNLPYPSYTEFNLKKYREKSLPLLMSRGCIFHCAFCDDWRLMGKYRSRQAEKIVEEIKHHLKQYRITNFCFSDPAINGNLNELERLCDLIIQNNLKITWIAPAIPSKEITFNLLKKMRKAGCLTLNYGIESGSNRILKLMRKLIIIEEVEQVLKDTRGAGIDTQVNFIIGFPGEGEEEFQETLKFIKRNRECISGVTNINTCNATLGSDLSYNCKKYDIIFPKDDLLRDSHWSCQSNTYQIRKERALKVINLLKQLKISIFTTNVFAKEKKQDTIDILLVICPPWGVETPPLGLACLSTYLRSRGLKLEIFDFNIYLYNKIVEKHKYLWEMGSANHWRKEESFNLLCSLFKKEIDFCIEKIISSGAKAVGFSVLSNSQDRITVRIIQQIKEKAPDIKIILGGISVSVDEQRRFFEEKISDLIEAYVIGEGEETLYEVLETIKSERALEGVPGVLIYQKGDYIYTPRALKENLDEFPFPTFEEFDLDAYLNKGKGLIMEWSRGCVGNCSFCAFKTISYKFRKKSPGLVIKAISYYVERYQVEHFSLADSAINGDLKCLEETCDLLIKTNFNVKFSCLAIPRRGMSCRLLEKIRKAGFIRIEYGVESGSDKVLKVMEKIYNSEDAENVIRATHKTGIMTVIYLIVGFPGEEEIELGETINFLKRNAQYIDLVKSVNPLYLMAGSPIYEDYKDYEISLSETDPDFRWFIGKENTYGIRLERVKKIRSILNEIGVKYFSEDDMFEREVDLKKIGLKEKVDKKDNLLLVTLPPWGAENPPLGLGYLDSYIRDKGLVCQVLDFNIYFYNSTDVYKMLWHVENKNYWSNERTFPLICELFKAQIDYAINRILSTDTDLIGFSVVDPKERLTIEVIKRIKDKAPYKKIILGGPACSTKEQRDFFTDNIPGYIDYFVVGEGEETLYEIIQRERDTLNRDNLAGVAIKVDGRWQYTPRQPINPVNTIPFPNYEGFELSQYNGGKSLLVEWSRGCIGRCSFCKNYLLVPGYRPKNPEFIIKELDFIINRYGIKEFTVCDPLMNGDIKQLSMLCDKMIKNGFKIRWSGQIAPRKEMDYGLFAKMCKAGCFKIQIGVESGSDKVLRNMRKIYTAKIAQENIIAAKRAGMEVEVFIMIGFPGEGEEEFKETFKFIKDNASYIDTIKSINTLHLIAGTDVYEKHKDFGIKPLPKNNWHYLWETWDGNNYQVRKKRGETLLDGTLNLSLNVLETNLKEGKESSLEHFLKEADTSKIDEAKERLKIQINKLQNFKTTKEKTLRKSVELKHYKKLRSGEARPQDYSLRSSLGELFTRDIVQLKTPGRTKSYDFYTFLYPKKPISKLVLIFILRFPLVSFLLILSIVTDFYVWLLKKIKKCIIFPGT